MGNLVDRRLCRPGCDHMKATWLDQGWACGYKNFQMLLSSLRHDPLYCNHLFGPERANQDIPSVSYLQKLIESAWAAGFDSAGREQLNGHLSNSTKWIGPTEIMACLANLNVK
jgi:zinc finger-containing ubiquitin peptidase 1